MERIAYYATYVHYLPYQVPIYLKLGGFFITDSYTTFLHVHQNYPEVDCIQYVDMPFLERSLWRQETRALIVSDHYPQLFQGLRSQGCKLIQTHHGVSHKKYLTRHGYDHYDLTLLPGEESRQRIIKAGKTHDHQKLQLVGLPKLDGLREFPSSVDKLRDLYQLDDRPVILYAPTWNHPKGGLRHSSLDKMMAPLLDSWPEDLQLLIKPHPNTFRVEPDLVEDLRIRIDGKSQIALIELSSRYSSDVLPLYQVADLLLGDVSSVNTEFYATGKPIVQIRCEQHEDNFNSQWDEACTVSAADDILPAIRYCLESDPFRSKRQSLLKRRIDPLDGKAAERSAIAIKELIDE